MYNLSQIMICLKYYFLYIDNLYTIYILYNWNKKAFLEKKTNITSWCKTPT